MTDMPINLEGGGVFRGPARKGCMVTARWKVNR